MHSPVPPTGIYVTFNCGNQSLGVDHLISGGGGGGVEENMEINKIFPILLKINKIFPSLLEINKLFLILPEKNELFHPKNNLFVGLIP